MATILANKMLNDSVNMTIVRDTVAIALTSTVLLVILLFAIFGNMAVILAVYKTHRLRNDQANRFIVNLSITDLSMAVIVMTSSLISIIQDDWRLSKTWCDIVCASNYCLIIVSMLTLCFISIDRYCAIKHPFDYTDIITKNRIRCMITYSWLQGFAFASAPAFCGWIRYDYWEAVCAIDWAFDMALYYVIVAFICCFLGPGVILVICYTRILNEANKMKVQPQGITLASNQREQTRFANKTIRSLLIVIIAFFICMTPFSLTKLIKVIFPHIKVVHPYINLSASLIAYVSSATNPLIYGIFRKDFRIAFQITLRRLFCPMKPLGNNLHMTTLSITN